jgi:UV DNA damage endonuclease
MSGFLNSSLHTGRCSINFSLVCSFTKRFSSIRRKKFLLHHPIILPPREAANMPPKRKRASVAAATAPENEISIVLHETPILPPNLVTKSQVPNRQASHRGKIDTNPDHNADIMDGKTALRASPDAEETGEALEVGKVNGGPKISMKTKGTNGTVMDEDSDSPLSEVELPAPTPSKKQKTPTKSSIAAKKGANEIKAFRAEQAAKRSVEGTVKKEGDADEWEKRLDPDGDDAGPAEDVDVMKKEAARPPPVNSDYLPLPWKGRLGYVSTFNSWKDLAHQGDFRHVSTRISDSQVHQSSPLEPAA